MDRFEQIYINEALEELNFKELLEVQEKVIPLLMNKKDVIVEANTGSGKTHAFLLPIFEHLNPNLQQVQALILAPTRELAKQIYDFAIQIAKHSPNSITVDLFIGGSDREDLIQKLGKRMPQIAIGTPGRVYDLVVKENLLKAYTCDYFIIDEADMTLESNFLDEVGNILSVVQSSATKAVFSATISEELKPFLRKYLDNPELIDVHPDEISSLNIEHYFVKTKEADRLVGLKKILSAVNPYLAIIFCNTKESSEEVFKWMKDNQYSVTLIHGGMDFRKRKQLMRRVNDLEFQYVVATDIMSRGIDIEGISHIINYELPRNIEFYIHRSGRSGRVDFDGICISLYEFNDNSYLDRLESKGLRCSYKEIRDREIRDATLRKQRSKREWKENELDYEAKRTVKKPKKVKPGYKKKYKQEVEKAKKKIAKKRR